MFETRFCVRNFNKYCVVLATDNIRALQEGTQQKQRGMQKEMQGKVTEKEEKA